MKQGDLAFPSNTNCWSNYFKKNSTSLFMYIRDLETAITQKYSK